MCRCWRARNLESAEQCGMLLVSRKYTPIFVHIITSSGLPSLKAVCQCCCHRQICSSHSKNTSHGRSKPGFKLYDTFHKIRHGSRERHTLFWARDGRQKIIMCLAWPAGGTQRSVSLRQMSFCLFGQYSPTATVSMDHLLHLSRA